MKLRLNGTILEFKEGTTLSGLLEELKIEPKGVAIEVNLNIIKKCDFQKYVIKESDSVEIVNFVGGG